MKSTGDHFSRETREATSLQQSGLILFFGDEEIQKANNRILYGDNEDVISIM